MTNPKTQNRFFIKKFVLGPLETNCYLVADPAARCACLIDPGDASRDIKDALRKNGFDLEFIINTHGHGDHIAANSIFNAPIYIHRLDADFLKDPDRNMSRSSLFAITSPPASKLLEDGDRVELGGLVLEIIHTPGHTPGSVSVKADDAIFTGDALFNGGIGRTDFPYGDEDILIKSIREKILCYGDDVAVYPGHGPSTTIGAEKRSNPFFM